MNSKQTQKHQLGILRDSFKKQMEEKDRKVEDLELLLSEANGGVSDTYDQIYNHQYNTLICHIYTYSFILYLILSPFSCREPQIPPRLP